MNDFEDTGRLWLRRALGAAELRCLDKATISNKRLSLSSELLAILGPDGPITTPLNAILPRAFPTRLVSFDKTKQANWGVPWHQDRVIAVADQAQVDGFTNWSNKAGVPHCEPARTVLDEMLFLRLHLDDENTGSGPMEIALGSHKFGPVAASDAASQAQLCQTETCLGQRGDVLVLKMLTLHRSAPAALPGTRRVLRVDYANSMLPPPLRWAACA